MLEDKLIFNYTCLTQGNVFVVFGFGITKKGCQIIGMILFFADTKKYGLIGLLNQRKFIFKQHLGRKLHIQCFVNVDLTNC